MTFTYQLLPTFRWQVSRGDMPMAVFATRDQAVAYCKRKNAELVQ